MAGPMLLLQVVYCPQPGQTDIVDLCLPEGASLADAVQASLLLTRYGLNPEQVKLGVWSRLKPPDTPVREGDRVEIYRPLTVDPKEARRLRYKRQRSTQRAV